MRVWALTDDEVQASVRTSDGRVQRAIRQAFIDYGFEPAEADLRSSAMFAAGIGMLHASGSAPAAPTELRDRFLEFMLRP